MTELLSAFNLSMGTAVPEGCGARHFPHSIDYRMSSPRLLQCNFQKGWSSTFWEETTVKKKPLFVCMCMDKSPLWVMNYAQADLVTLCSVSFSLDSPSETWGIITPLCFPGLLFIVFNLKTVFHINHSKYWDFKIPSVPLAWTKGWRAWTVHHEPVLTSPVSRLLWWKPKCRQDKDEWTALPTAPWAGSPVLSTHHPCLNLDASFQYRLSKGNAKK